MKEKVRTVWNVDFMSSEEDMDDYFEVRPLQWRSAECDTLFEQLDNKLEKLSSNKSKRQSLKRKTGLDVVLPLKLITIKLGLWEKTVNIYVYERIFIM